MNPKDKVFAVRGAIQLSENSVPEMESCVAELISTITSWNAISHDQIISVLFSQTSDLTINPAQSLRNIASKFHGVALFCNQEPQYDNSLPMIIRVLINYYSSPAHSPVPCYLRGAQQLRPDLG